MGAGTFIVAVNGRRSNAHDLMQRCKNDKVLRLTIAPAACGEDLVPATSSVAPAANGQNAAATTAEAAGCDLRQGAFHAEAISNLASMGFSEVQAKDALARSSGNMERAVNLLMGENLGGSGGGDNQARTPEGLVQLLAMGFPDNKAREALLASNGNLDYAISLCTSTVPRGLVNTAGPPQAAVSSIMAMGFTEQQARDALDGGNGDVDRAIAILVG